MKKRGLTASGKLFLGIWVILCIIIIGLLKSLPLEKPTSFKLDNVYPCIEMDGEWVRVKSFTAQDAIYICGNIRSGNNSKTQMQIQIRAYVNEITSQVDAVYYDNIWVSVGEITIPIRAVFVPGTYVIQISNGRITLDTIEILIN